MGPSKAALPNPSMNDFGPSIPGTPVRTMPFERSVFPGVSIARAGKFKLPLLGIIAADVPGTARGGLPCR